MKRIAAAAAALGIALSPFSQAQTYPTKTVSLGSDAMIAD